MAKKSNKSKAPELPVPEKPKTKTLELHFEFSSDRFSEEALACHSIVANLNRFRDQILKYDYQGWTPVAIEHTFRIEFE